MKNSTYDTIKRIALLIIPFLSAFVETVGLAWNIPYTSEIVITINAFNIFIGAIVEKASADYKTLQSHNTEESN